MYNINITKLRGENLNNLNIEIVMIRQVNIFFILETRLSEIMRQYFVIFLILFDIFKYYGMITGLRHDIFFSNVYLK